MAITIYTTADGKAYTAGDGTLIVIGSLLSLITDRTPRDVEEVKALTEAIKAGTATEPQVRQYLEEINKGAYTYRDLNRVEDAVQYVATRLREFGYLKNTPTVRYWGVEDKPNANDFARYFTNVAMLRDAIAVWETTPEAPRSVVGFDTSKANALERILVDVDQILDLIFGAWFFSGDTYSGEV